MSKHNREKLLRLYVTVAAVIAVGALMGVLPLPISWSAKLLLLHPIVLVIVIKGFASMQKVEDNRHDEMKK